MKSSGNLLGLRPAPNSQRNNSKILLRFTFFSSNCFVLFWYDQLVLKYVIDTELILPFSPVHKRSFLFAQLAQRIYNKRLVPRSFTQNSELTLLLLYQNLLSAGNLGSLYSGKWTITTTELEKWIWYWNLALLKVEN